MTLLVNMVLDKKQDNQRRKNNNYEARYMSAGIIVDQLNEIETVTEIIVKGFSQAKHPHNGTKIM